MKKSNALLLFLILLMMNGCRFDRKVTEKDVLGLIWSEPDTIDIVFGDSQVGITKYKERNSNDTLYIDNLYIGEDVIDVSIYVSPYIRYVNLQNMRTIHIDSLKKIGRGGYSLIEE